MAADERIVGEAHHHVVCAGRYTGHGHRALVVLRDGGHVVGIGFNTSLVAVAGLAALVGHELVAQSGDERLAAGV